MRKKGFKKRYNEPSGHTIIGVWNGGGGVDLSIWCDSTDDLVVTGCHDIITDFNSGVHNSQGTGGWISLVRMNRNKNRDEVRYDIYINTSTAENIERNR